MLQQPPAPMPRRSRPWPRLRQPRDRGQTLVEFAFVLPIFIMMLLAIIEFAFVFNAISTINYASRNAALVAAEIGDNPGADCQILESIDNDVQAPETQTEITQVTIFWANSGLATPPANVYERTGSTSCTLPGGSVVTVPYTATQTDYPDSGRCNILAGCSGHPSGTLDQIGITISYRYSWKTPLRGFVALGGSDFTITRSNTMRMEPIL